MPLKGSKKISFRTLMYEIEQELANVFKYGGTPYYHKYHYVYAMMHMNAELVRIGHHFEENSLQYTRGARKKDKNPVIVYVEQEEQQQDK